MPHAGCSSSETDGEAQPAATPGDKKHGGRRLRGYPKRLTVLQAKLCSLTAQAGQLLTEQQQLREREEALYTHIQEQGEFVHDIVALLAQQQQQQQQTEQGSPSQQEQSTSSDSSNTCSDREEAVLHALSQSAINDLRIQHALLVLGKGSSSSSSAGRRGELRSTACLRAALTPDNIAWARRATLPEVVGLYRGRIMRAAFLLAHPDKAGLGQSLEAVVDDVITTHMLLFAAADKLVLQLSLVNCDTCKHEVPSPDHFRNVAAALQLSQEQTQQLRSAFKVYTTRRSALIARMQPLARQMSALLNKACVCSCHARTQPTAAAPATAAHASCAAAGGAAHINVISSSSGSSSSHSCSSCACAGASVSTSSCLSLEEAEALAGLLGQYEAAVGQCRLLGRSLSWHWLNTLSARQLAAAAVAAYPMYLQPIQICAAI